MIFLIYLWLKRWINQFWKLTFFVNANLSFHEHFFESFTQNFVLLNNYGDWVYQTQVLIIFFIFGSFLFTSERAKYFLNLTLFPKIIFPFIILKTVYCLCYADPKGFLSLLLFIFNLFQGIWHDEKQGGRKTEDRKRSCWNEHTTSSISYINCLF